MAGKNAVVATENIEAKILLIRGQKVMLDADLAELYGVAIRVLNQAVKRNTERFPEDFMFQLTAEEFSALRSQIVTLKTGRGQHRKYLPYVFTEHGALMLGNVLKSDRAVEVSLIVVRAFVHLRELVSSHKELAQKLNQLERKVGAHDRAIAELINARVQRQVAEWCQCFPAEKQSRYIYEQWLLEGGSHDAVSQNIAAWLARHDRELDAVSVLGALSGTNAQWDLYQENMKRWLERHRCNQAATYFYRAWLDSGRNPTPIQNSISAWLESNAKWINADFVLNAWLKRENTSTEIVQAGYKQWIATHGRTFQARTVNENWDAALERERKAQYR